MSETRPAWLTPPEIARLLRCRGSKVLTWIRTGRLAAIDVSDTNRPRYRIARAALDEFLANRAVTPASRPASRLRRDIPRYV
jgi:excisionase family DNA binding protein